jgi:hypothetical protein
MLTILLFTVQRETIKMKTIKKGVLTDSEDKRQ